MPLMRMITLNQERSIRNGEVVGFEFNTKYESKYDCTLGNCDERPNVIIGSTRTASSSVNSSNVDLVNQITDRFDFDNFNLDIQSLPEMYTQKDYNEWLYNAITSIDGALLGNIDGGGA